MILR
jgi:hypothetical protein